MGVNRRGLMLILSAPSGTGKTTVANLLLQQDAYIRMSVSCTTRSKRDSEIDGVHYWFKTVKEFKDQIHSGDFLEHAEIFGNLYGTPKQGTLTALEQGIDLLFVIDWQGHRRLIKYSRADVASVFMLPPSKAELWQRLKLRNQDAERVLEKRMCSINEEISHWEEYDYVIVNRNLDSTVNKLLCILRAERLKKARRVGLANFVSDIICDKIC